MVSPPTQVQHDVSNHCSYILQTFMPTWWKYMSETDKWKGILWAHSSNSSIDLSDHSCCMVGECMDFNEKYAFDSLEYDSDLDNISSCLYYAVSDMRISEENHDWDTRGYKIYNNFIAKLDELAILISNKREPINPELQLYLEYTKLRN